MTFREALRHGTELLQQRADLAEYAAQDAQMLLQLAAGVDRPATLAWPQRLLTEEQYTSFLHLLRQRLDAVPMQHLRGEQEFYGRPFRVNGDVLIPRPETELLIDETLRRVSHTQPIRIADVGTGSGAIAVTLALALPQAEVWALDISEPALAVARRNAAELGAADRIRFLQSDLLAAADAEVFDAIVSNPPYVALSDRETLHAQVREYEPELALFGGPDGHDVYRQLIPQAWQRLRPGGWLLLETGGSVDILRGLLAAWTDVSVAQDLQGWDRFICACRP